LRSQVCAKKHILTFFIISDCEDLSTGFLMNLQKKLKNFFFSPQNEGKKSYTDVHEEAFGPLLLHSSGIGNKPCVAAFPDSTRAENVWQECCQLLELCGQDTERVLLLPAAGRGKMLYAGAESRRARVLNAALQHEFDIIIGSVNALFGPAPLPDVTRDALITLKPGMTLPPELLLEKLVAIDYDDEYESTIPGEFARRGGIVDVYSPAYDYPCRIEYFGDEIESLRSFDPSTQRSTGKLDEYRIIGRGGVTAGGEADGDIFSYFDAGKVELRLFYPAECEERLEKFSSGKMLDRFGEVVSQAKDAGTLEVFHLIDDDGSTASSPVVPLYMELALGTTPDTGGTAGKLTSRLVMSHLETLLEKGSLLCVLRHEGDIGELQKWCRENFSRHENISFAAGDLRRGFWIEDIKCGAVTLFELAKAGFHHDLDNSNADTVTSGISDDNARITAKSEEQHFADLESGDLAVHIDHGIGIFRGFKVLNSNGFSREVIVMEYRDGQLLYVPLLSAHKISRYLGSPGKVPLHRLGSSRWEKDKETARRGVRSYAADMLRMQAVRQTVSGLPMTDRIPNWKSFLRAFPFDDTPDQTRATNEIARDMCSGRPMDRLLCGDVGYGKTEVAMRAAFIAVSCGYQVAVLAPTTVLVQQHYRSFLERFAGYPVTVAVLNRYKTAAEQDRIISNLATGGVDIIIGTHRLCGKNIKFKNLGLVIIDEEQRFGVNHKERLRRFRTEVAVLTMSATPIPRTLYLAMAGARDLSTLTTAPKLRTPVRTVIAPEDIKLACGAIRTELARGGQVYYLHNRVNSINRRAEVLQSYLPDCRIAVAHARMAPELLEEVMNDFVAGKIDCLVSTTIIESGLDVPNANTIIIERADRFGLAELYQLRGRVGRSSRQAYSYMFLPRDAIVTSDARKRLAALRRCTTQGAGFQLALRDLEIRGSGNLLGAEQSGHLNMIGFDLYCQLLKMEVAKLSGKEVKFTPEVNIAIDFVTFSSSENARGMLCALFPSKYIGGERLRVDAYRRLATLDSISGLEDFKNELADRFGKLPKEAVNLLDVSRLRILGQIAGLRSISVVDNVVILMTPENEVYRERNGKRPVLDGRDSPELRLVHLKKILLDVCRRYAPDATAR
jgi:transcription-repair coupling factor (superfamily II helicase)